MLQGVPPLDRSKLTPDLLICVTPAWFAPEDESELNAHLSIDPGGSTMSSTSTPEEGVIRRVIDEDVIKRIEDFKDPGQEWRRLFSEFSARSSSCSSPPVAG